MRKNSFNCSERKEKEEEKKVIIVLRTKKTELFKAINRPIDLSQLIGQIYLSLFLSLSCKQNDGHVL